MKPILFNTSMVRAILDGRKTVTRRVVKIKGWKITGLPTWATLGDASADGVFFSVAGVEKKTATCEFAYPPYKTGDILYVRETWGKTQNAESYVYKADFDGYAAEVFLPGMKWHPSMHMLKEAARIFLRVTNVRVERLQDILEDPPGPNNQVVREGCRYTCDFIATWENTIKKADRGLYGWDANPWVWVIDFERCEKPKGE